MVIHRATTSLLVLLSNQGHTSSYRDKSKFQLHLSTPPSFSNIMKASATQIPIIGFSLFPNRFSSSQVTNVVPSVLCPLKQETSLQAIWVELRGIAGTQREVYPGRPKQKSVVSCNPGERLLSSSYMAVSATIKCTL